MLSWNCILLLENSFPVQYFAQFEDLINEVFRFYNDKALKRKAHLRETAIGLNAKMYELNYIYHTRWISSEYQAVINLKKMWAVLAADLRLISNSEQFDRNVRTLAGKLKLRITSKYFLIMLYFITDILHILHFWSQRMQQRTALLVEFADFKKDFNDNFEYLKINNGRDLSLFIGSVSCEGVP